MRREIQWPMTPTIKEEGGSIESCTEEEVEGEEVEEEEGAMDQTDGEGDQ